MVVSVCCSLRKVLGELFGKMSPFSAPCKVVTNGSTYEVHMAYMAVHMKEVLFF